MTRSVFATAEHALEQVRQVEDVVANVVFAEVALREAVSAESQRRARKLMLHAQRCLDAADHCCRHTREARQILQRQGVRA